jgi:murein L,D-transpeptidase YcbB/YkuD
MFPNLTTSYLHDTPSRNLFESDDRAFSSGLHPVENPLTLAELLLVGQSVWNRQRSTRRRGRRDPTVTIKPRVPVLLSPTGDRLGSGRREIQFRRDIYAGCKGQRGTRNPVPLHEPLPHDDGT